jgi:hypothetical protein
MPDVLPPIGERILALNACAHSLATKENELHRIESEKSIEVSERWKYYTDDSSNEIKKECVGDKRLDTILECLETLDKRGYMRSNQQREFHKSMIVACLYKIYGSELNRNLVKLLKRFGVTEVKQDVIFITPRRYGKTMAVALYATAYMMSIPGTTVSIYSTGKRASKRLLGLVGKMIIDLNGSKNVIKSFNQETIEVTSFDGPTSTCNCYPGKEEIGQVETRYFVHIISSVTSIGTKTKEKKPCLASTHPKCFIIRISY